MDVWEWVSQLRRELRDSGRDDVADAIGALPSAANGGELDRALALTTELVAQAQALELPWLEVFARHWRLQALHSDEQGATTLAEATSLFELAHRDETERCPQTVCVTQDLCIGYSFTDGPGYARDRIAVASETLDRIDPSWPCWACVTCELVDGLLDAGEVEEGAAELDRRWGALLAAGETPSLALERERATVLLRRGRHEEVITLVDDLARRSHPGWNVDRKQGGLDLFRADALSRLGRGVDALANLPPPDRVERWALDRAQWIRTVEQIVATGALENTAGVGGQIHAFVEHFLAGGAWRLAFDAAHVEARLALARGANWVAADALAAMRRAQAELRVDGGAAEAVTRIAGALASIEGQVVHLPVPASELLAHVGALEVHDPETEIEWLRRASIERPEDDELVALHVRLLGLCRRDDLGRAVLGEAYARRPGSELLAGLLVEVALEDRSRSLADVEAVAARVAPDHPTLALWARARANAREQRWAEVADLCSQIAAQEDDAFNTRRLWARALRHLGDHATAVDVLTFVIDRADDEHASRGDHWERMVDATIVGRWDLVHRSARTLGMTYETTEGPIDERWEPIGLEFTGTAAADASDLGREVVAAVRTGPVTARVRGISPGNDPQRHGDLVVFDAAPLTFPPDDADDDARRSFVFRYAAVATIESGGRTGWVIDGVDPGEERYWPFVQALDDAGIAIWIYSGDDYRLTAPSGEVVPGLYGRVATPSDMPAGRADALLTQLTAPWPHPLTWLDLAAAAGTDVARHRRIIDAYGL